MYLCKRFKKQKINYKSNGTEILSTSQTYQEGGSISTSGEHRSSDVNGNGTVNNGVGLKLTDLNTTLYWS